MTQFVGSKSYGGNYSNTLMDTNITEPKILLKPMTSAAFSKKDVLVAAA